MEINGYRILQCYSTGDPRFSDKHARLANGQTIEDMYQSSMREETHTMHNGKLKGFTPAYIHWAGHDYLATPAFRHMYYTLLWYIYFKENPKLLAYASSHLAFFEFDGGDVFRHETLNEPFWDYGELKCNQALSICWLVSHYQQHHIVGEQFPDELKMCFNSYWRKYHSQVVEMVLP
jgi:hypothetical protein